MTASKSKAKSSATSTNRQNFSVRGWNLTNLTDEDMSKTHRERAQEIIEKLETGDGFANYDYITNLIEVSLSRLEQETLTRAVEAVEKCHLDEQEEDNDSHSCWAASTIRIKAASAIKALKGE